MPRTYCPTRPPCSAWGDWTRTPVPSRGGWHSDMSRGRDPCGPDGRLVPRPAGGRAAPSPRWAATPPCARRCLEQMAQDGLQLQELFVGSPLCKEDQGVLLRAVRKARPGFSPPPRPQPPPPVSSSPLLREIYAKVSPACGGPVPGGEPGCPIPTGSPCTSPRGALPAPWRLKKPQRWQAWSHRARPGG